MAVQTRGGCDITTRPKPPPRTVKPINLTGQRLPMIAATVKNGCLRADWSPMRVAEIPDLIRATGPGLIVTNDSHRLFLALEAAMGDDPAWQVKVTVREGVLARGDERIRFNKTVIGFLGLKRAKGERRANHYWHILDPSIFLDDAKAAMSLPELMLWGKDVQDWCAGIGIKVRATAGGLAGQLLRHPRFYPEPRRKVPGATNEKARFALPGNHYELRARHDIKYVADYIDQQSAHHSAAASTPVPDAYTYALGHYRLRDSKLPDEPWTDVADLGGRLGLIYARITTPDPVDRFTDWKDHGHMLADFRPGWAKVAGSRMAWLYTNELDLLADLGGRVEYVTAAWLADRADEGIPRFAQWALKETAEADAARRTWLKRVLLTPYGILAAKPDHFECGWRQTEKGEKVRYPVGGRMVEFMAQRTSKPVHPRIAHVIQRGMIEAETRKRSITFANGLLADRQHVLCIYGDGVLVRVSPWRDTTRSLLPAPWRHKGRLTQLHFINEQAFESEQVVRLPGIPVCGRVPSIMTG